MPRADWVIDLMPYATRGMYGNVDPASERFDESTWVTRDICAREPWPFEDGKFDFVVCAHTLEDVRDPVWVCNEMNRVARAGYIETPSRLEEQTYGIHGPWVGWSHHHWLVEAESGTLTFVFKSHVLHGRRDFAFRRGFADSLRPEERVVSVFWEGNLECRERIFLGPGEIDDYLARPVRQRGNCRPRGILGRIAERAWTGR
jgi:SAM-dependent methyltransferase